MKPKKELRSSKNHVKHGIAAMRLEYLALVLALAISTTLRAQEV